MDSSPSRCPHQAGQARPAAGAHPAGQWPPGPRSGLTGWPLLRQMAGDLLGTLGKWQRDYGDLVHLRIWPEHELVVTDPERVRELLVASHASLVRWERGIKVFAQLHGHSVLIAEGQAWRTKREALQPAFTPKSVQAVLPTMVAASEKTLAQWPQQAVQWPIEHALTSLAMEVIVRMLFSADIGDEARSAEQAVHDISVAANAEFYWPMHWPDAMPWKRAKREGLAMLNDLVRRHLHARLALPAAQRPKDLLSRLLQLHDADAQAWPLQAVHDECMTAFLAGHETVAATLTWWSWCMAAHPEAQRQAATEVRQQLQGRAPTAADLPRLGWLTQTLQETLRLYPAAPVLLSRRSTAPITLGPWQVPARTMFLVPVWLMHLDPRWFPQPLAFRPERFADDAPAIPRGAWLPFGIGPRVCLGQHLAMAEMTVVAAMLLQRFVLSVPEGASPPEPQLNVSLRPARPLHLQLAPAAASRGR